MQQKFSLPRDIVKFPTVTELHSITIIIGAAVMTPVTSGASTRSVAAIVVMAASILMHCFVFTQCIIDRRRGQQRIRHTCVVFLIIAEGPARKLFLLALAGTARGLIFAHTFAKRCWPKQGRKKRVFRRVTCGPQGLIVKHWHATRAVGNKQHRIVAPSHIALGTEGARTAAPPHIHIVRTF